MADETIDKSLQDLTGKWKDEVPKEGYSSSIQLRTYELYSKKISDYSNDDLRFMIGQRMGLRFLVPIALNLLKSNILIETNYFEGDLLKSVLVTPKSFWEKNLKLYGEFYEILLRNKDQLSKLDTEFSADRNLVQHLNDFLQILYKK